MIYLARGIEDHHYWVVQELDGALIETSWRVEREPDGYRLSHADDSAMTSSVFDLGAFNSPEAAVRALREHLER
ncbi:hypothetical protein [Herbiconiux daphne]|uniref:DUF1508 domain-containing protein n=1 Tax=Herbiconiux daphne TaxID=2970914 RepID=A0ABT2H765_9MICO|nr:hypothetical protein [Herbiconiux daphne]MCS5735761.1 hypothetical protein [Herbiconiux daphne]